jgi:hypothetical protein
MIEQAIINSRLVQVHFGVPNTPTGLKPEQVALFAPKIGDKLARNKHLTHALPAAEIAALMKQGSSIDVVDVLDPYHLLAHAHILNGKTGGKIIGGWTSFMPNFGGAVMRRAAREAGKYAKLVTASVSVDNPEAIKVITEEVGGVLLDTTTSQFTARPVHVFDLTYVGKEQI